MARRAEQPPFVPSPVFPASVGGHIGFYVRTQVEDHMEHIGFGWDMDSDDRDQYRVVFTTPRVIALRESIGQTIDVPGHCILAYSGSAGAWAPAAVRPKS